MLRGHTIIIIWIMISGCTSRPLRYSDDFRDFAETAKNSNHSNIYFRDSTYTTALSIETDGHMLYWVDSKTKIKKEDLLRNVMKITFYDRKMGPQVGLGALIGTIAASKMIAIENDESPFYSWKFPHIFSYDGLSQIAMAMVTGGIIGGSFVYLEPITITYTVSDSLR